MQAIKYQEKLSSLITALDQTIYPDIGIGDFKYHSEAKHFRGPDTLNSRIKGLYQEFGNRLVFEDVTDFVFLVCEDAVQYSTVLCRSMLEILIKRVLLNYFNR